MTYKFNLKEYAGNVQDSIAYHDYESREWWNKKFSDYWDWDEAFKEGKKMYPNLAKNNIASFCDGSDNVAPYFSPWDAETEAQGQADALDIELDGPGEYNAQ